MYDVFLQEVIQLNFLPVCIILFLIIFLIFNDPFEHRLTLLFMTPLIMVLILVVIDNLDYYLLNIGDNSKGHVLVAVLGYNDRIFLMLSLILVAFRNIKNRLLKKLLFIPGIVNLFITFLALFTELVFWYGPQGELHRGTLSYTPHVVSLFYSLVLFVYALWITLYGRDNEGVIIFLMVTLSIAGTAVETFFQLRGVLVGVVAMDIIFYYLYIHIEHYKVDVLTGTLNRDSFLADIKDLSPSDAVDVISVDMNDLKLINDTRGHLAGDEAIKAVVIELRRALDSYLGKCRIYRVGGDEFVIICRRLSQSDLDRIFDRFGQIIKESGYSFAAGSAHWGEGESFDAVYGRADKEMYKAKEKYHHLRK